MFALALLASAVSAQYYGGYGIPQVPHYGYAPVQHAPVQQPYQPYQRYQAHPAPATSHVENPWAAVPADPVTTGWYSPTEQYSPPRIAYKPVASEVVFALCEITSGNVVSGELQFAQFPGKPILYRGGLTASASAVVSVTINELGVIGDGATCDNVGDEFNPLAEIDKYNQPNPFQDPARGTINARELTADGSGDITVAASSENIILQNLAGKDSLIGRSITFADVGGNKDCCIIARDILPPQYVPEPFYPKGNTANYSKGYYGH